MNITEYDFKKFKENYTNETHHDKEEVYSNLEISDDDKYLILSNKQGFMIYLVQSLKEKDSNPFVSRAMKGIQKIHFTGDNQFVFIVQDFEDISYCVVR